MKLLKLSLAGLAALQLSACSQTKTVDWEEEVVLNTGEVIWVNRADTFRRGTEPGNPLKSTWWPDGRFYEFSWQGQKYTYRARSKVGGPILMFVDPADKSILLIDSTFNLDCAKPGYGEFRWNHGSWQLQQNVSLAVVGQPRNLMSYYSAAEGAIPARVTQEFIRSSRFDSPQNGGAESNLSASKIALDCSRSK